MKKRACILVVFLLCLAFLGCTPAISSAVGSSNENSSVSSSQATGLLGSVTESSTAPSSSGTELTVEQMHRIIAQLMKVDGSGEIRIGERKAVLLEVLNRHGIPTQDQIVDIFAGDTIFYLDTWSSISRVQFFYQIDSGLKSGDTVSKMKQIYGVNYIAVKSQFNRGLFAYPMGNNTTLYIEAQGTSDESVIVDIEVAWPGFWGEAHQ